VRVRAKGHELSSTPSVTPEQHPVELVLARALITNLATPAFLVDRAGNLLFFNEPAGELLGIHFEEAGPMAQQDWGGRFTPTDEGGHRLAIEQLPLSIAISEGRPAHAPMRIDAADGKEHLIEVTAFPIVGRAGQSGAIAIFWETPR
jgi:PAS domain-containing protein